MRFDALSGKVSDLIDAGVMEIGDGYRAKNSELSDEGLPFARAANINDGFKFDGADCFPVDRVSSVGKKVSCAGDVVFTSKGTVGRFAFVTADVPRFVYSPQLCYWRSLDHQRLNPRYLYFWMQSQEFLHQIGYLKNQTDMADYVSLRDQREMTLTIPDSDVQYSIANFLGAIESRIDNLCQTSTTLEAVAQALFKSWFVDFDPVHAKSEGRVPEAMDAVTAALFPSEFEESELGLIPKGWHVDEVGNAVKCLGGGTPSTKEDAYWRDGEFHWVTPKDLSGLQAPVLITTDRKITSAGLSRISSGLLPVGTLLMSSRAPIGYLALTGTSTAINQGFIAMPPGGTLPPLYLFFWARINMDLIKQSANGSTFMEISKKAFRPIKLCIPPPELVDAFVAIASPLMSRIEANEHHRVTLTELRDTLLPRLISGKLRLPETAEETLA